MSRRTDRQSPDAPSIARIRVVNAGVSEIDHDSLPATPLVKNEQLDDIEELLQQIEVGDRRMRDHKEKDTADHSSEVPRKSRPDHSNSKSVDPLWSAHIANRRLYSEQRSSSIQNSICLRREFRSASKKRSSAPPHTEEKSQMASCGIPSKRKSVKYSQIQYDDLRHYIDDCIMGPLPKHLCCVDRR